MSCFLMLIYTGPVSKLIILALYGTGSPKIVTSVYSFSFCQCGSPKYSTTLGAMWFLVTPLFTIALNCLSFHLTLKSKYFLIVPLRA